MEQTETYGGTDLAAKATPREQVGNDGSAVSEACDALDSAIDRLAHQQQGIETRLAPVAMPMVEKMGEAVGENPEPPRSRLSAYLFQRARQVNRIADALAETSNTLDL